jgi:hypothetical protein
VTFANETVSGWQTALFATPVAVVAKTAYVASYHSNGYYSADSGFFVGAYANGLLSAPPSTATSGNGVYAYGSSVFFPAASYNATNYWVDIIYLPDPPTAPPAITSALAAAGTAGAPFTYQISATTLPTSFNAIGLPAGLSVNTATGVISGTPITAGLSSVTLIAINAKGTGSNTLSLTVKQAPIGILGSQIIETALDSNPLGIAEAFQVTATASGKIGAISIYLDASSTVTRLVAGVYADSAGRPGALLSQSATSQLNPGAWNDITIPGAVVASGTPYWIAILGTNSGALLFRDGSGCKSEISQQTNLTDLPSTWSSGTVWNSCPLSGFGKTAP